MQTEHRSGRGGPRQPGDPGGQPAREHRLCRSGRLGQQHQLHRQLDLEDRVGAGDLTYAPDLGQRRLGERGAVAQRTDRAEGEHGQVQVPGHAGLEHQVGDVELRPQPLEHREGVAHRRHVTEVEVGAVQGAPPPDAQRRGLVVVGPVAGLDQLQVRVVPQAVHDGDHPVATLAGLPVGERSQPRAEHLQRRPHRLLRRVPGQTSHQMRPASDHRPSPPSSRCCRHPAKALSPAGPGPSVPADARLAHLTHERQRPRELAKVCVSEISACSCRRRRLTSAR